MPRKTMNTSEKKGRGPSGSGSPSRALRNSASPSLAATTNNRAGSSSSSGGGSAVIAPPPRAALSGTSSPAPDDHRNHERGNSGSQAAPGSATTTSGSSGSSNAALLPATAAAVAAASVTSMAHLLKEKDARIVHLERELGIMESEFQRELDKLSTTESETALFWQAKHSALNQQFLRTDTELRLLRTEVELREAERNELRAGWESMRRDLRERDAEVRNLKSQIRGLKEWVSNSTRSNGQAQTSDEVFGDGMARLGNGLQNWVLVHFRKAKLDLAKADGQALEELGRLVPMYEDLVSAPKVHLLQSVVSRIVVELVFDAYFVGLSSDQAQQFTHMETLLASYAGSPEPINQWRSLTLTILKREAAQKMQVETSRVTETVVSRVNALLSSITDTKPTEARDQGLAALVNSAIDLSRLFVVQKAVFKVSMPEILPHQKIMFDPATMEDIGGEDEESLTEREICCVTFPGIIKRGDENGGHLQYRNVISKARVLCSPE
ncbi:hypothetical protein QBC46DRAFT_415392 [Diplogelasinospora grovesii]|uniref:Involucrin repeat protein n=1 Tax=Diplogelasinospora grovesii TaxID=303347 RepID=A0AAN6S9V1_9PEZI|nr:hypothetical protein QBC46DRAFT_415392 [Diplogelasinospora grovesii]